MYITKDGAANQPRLVITRNPSRDVTGFTQAQPYAGFHKRLI
jgi:hypothetical protein